MAAGLTVERSKLAAFRAFLEERLVDSQSVLAENRILRIDGALTARGANAALVDLVERAGPYGAGHPQPVFAFPAHQVRKARLFGTDHVGVDIVAGDGAPLAGVAFRCAETELGRLLLSNAPRLHVAGSLGFDSFRGQRRVQLRIVDAALPDDRL
jgi:single-stranded-DNA-specific exonuclease